MKILLAIDDYNQNSDGGACFVVRSLAEKLCQKHEVIILTTHREGADKVKKEKNIIVHSIKVNYPMRFRSFFSIYNSSINRKLKDILQIYKPNIVHAHTIHTYISYHFLKLSKDFGAKIIFTGHDVMPVFYGRLTQFIDSDNDGIWDTLDIKAKFLSQAWRNKLHFNPFRNHLIKRYLNGVKVVVVSGLLKNVFLINGIKVYKVIKNGVAIEKWKVNEVDIKSFRSKYNLENKKLILFGGRIRKDKGSYIVLHILNQLDSNTFLLVVGKKSGFNEMLKYSKSLNLNNRLIYLGFLNHTELKIAYKSSDITIIPSICLDTLSNMAIESMASGSPTIVSKFCGISEYLINKKHAVIINPFDIKNSAIELNKVLYEKNYSDKLSQYGRKLIKNNFSIEKMIYSYEAIYNEC